MEKVNKNVKKYTNQRECVTYKCSTESIDGNKELFSIRNLAAETYAMRNLTTSNEKNLYLYLSSNQAGYTYGYSPKSVTKSYGGSIRNLSTAFDKLVKLGYIVFDNPNDEDSFSFHEVPVSQIKNTDKDKHIDYINYSCQNDMTTDDKEMNTSCQNDMTPHDKMTCTSCQNDMTPHDKMTGEIIQPSTLVQLPSTGNAPEGATAAKAASGNCSYEQCGAKAPKSAKASNAAKAASSKKSKFSNPDSPYKDTKDDYEILNQVPLHIQDEMANLAFNNNIKTSHEYLAEKFNFPNVKYVKAIKGAYMKLSKNDLLDKIPEDVQKQIINDVINKHMKYDAVTEETGYNGSYIHAVVSSANTNIIKMHNAEKSGYINIINQTPDQGSIKEDVKPVNDCEAGNEYDASQSISLQENSKAEVIDDNESNDDVTEFSTEVSNANSTMFNVLSGANITKDNVREDEDKVNIYDIVDDIMNDDWSEPTESKESNDKFDNMNAVETGRAMMAEMKAKKAGDTFLDDYEDDGWGDDDNTSSEETESVKSELKLVESEAEVEEDDDNSYIPDHLTDNIWGSAM